MKFHRHAAIASIVAISAAISGCESSDPPREFYDKDVADVSRDRRQSTIGDLLEADRALDETGGNLAVNKFLWQASLDTLAFLPLDSTDPFSGVVSTEWGESAAAPGERFKVTAYVTSPRLEAQSLRVAVYREVRDENGAWVSASVDPGTARKIEDSILTRARQMKVALISREEELAAPPDLEELQDE